MKPSTPRTESELLARAEEFAGLTVAKLAERTGKREPQDLRGHKGWVGELLESALGACSQSRPVPDFEHLGIEMKTIPINANGRPRESTHVCTVGLRDLVGERWKTSTVYIKLQRVLWIPIEAAPSIPLARRRIGRALIWSPTASQERVLREDWEEHIELIATGHIDELDARLGTYLQIRPKAATARALAPATDATGAPAHTLPRGFYLRPSFTHLILSESSVA